MEAKLGPASPSNSVHTTGSGASGNRKGAKNEAKGQGDDASSAGGSVAASEVERVPVHVKIANGAVSMYNGVVATGAALGRAIEDPVGEYRLFRKSLSKKRDELEGTVQKYGPPYVEDYGGNLIVEIDMVEVDEMEVHGMLSSGANPNIGDPDDGNATPMHYAAKHLHLHIMKMLKRAGGNLHVQDDLGLTPLSSLCLRYHQGREKEEADFLEYLVVDEGANVNNLDKAGHTPLEYAALNGNASMVSWLLQHGAKALRIREFLCLPREDMTESIPNIIARSMYKAALEAELSEHRAEQARIKASQIKGEKVDRVRQAQLRRAARAEAKRANGRLLAKLEEQALLEEEKAKQQQMAKDQILSDMDVRSTALGRWERATTGPQGEEGHTVVRAWMFVKRESKEAWERQDPSEVLYQEAEVLMKEIDSRSTDPRLAQRWRQVTGTTLNLALPTQEEQDALDAEAMRRVKDAPSITGTQDDFADYMPPDLYEA